MDGQWVERPRHKTQIFPRRGMHRSALSHEIPIHSNIFDKPIPSSRRGRCVVFVNMSASRQIKRWTKEEDAILAEQCQRQIEGAYFSFWSDRRAPDETTTVIGVLLVANLKTCIDVPFPPGSIQVLLSSK